MVAKSTVLFRIEHLEQGRTRVAAIVASELIDLVKQDHRVGRAGTFHELDDLARHRTDVRPAVAADLGFVMDAAKREPDELTSRRVRYRLAQEVLPTPGAPTKHNIVPFGFLTS